eukprot:Skav208361  [mRNA]  locus=scaffold1964:364436:365666:- [translate_table: standard]
MRNDQNNCHGAQLYAVGRPWLFAALLAESRAVMAGRIKGMKPWEVTQILMADARSKRWEDACNRLFEMPRMRLSPVNLYHFNAVSLACQRAVAWQSSLKLLDLQESGRPAPDVISYNTTLSACAKAERWPWALWLLRTMKVEADSISCSAATSAWLLALALLGDALRQSVAVDRVFFATVISCCAKAARWRSALRLFEQVPRAAGS